MFDGSFVAPRSTG